MPSEELQEQFEKVRSDVKKIDKMFGKILSDDGTEEDASRDTCPECGSKNTKMVEEVTPIRSNPQHEPKGGGIRWKCKSCNNRWLQ